MRISKQLFLFYMRIFIGYYYYALKIFVELLSFLCCLRNAYHTKNDTVYSKTRAIIFWWFMFHSYTIKMTINIFWTIVIVFFVKKTCLEHDNWRIFFNEANQNRPYSISCWIKRYCLGVFTNYYLKNLIFFPFLIKYEWLCFRQTSNGSYYQDKVVLLFDIVWIFCHGNSKLEHYCRRNYVCKFNIL